MNTSANTNQTGDTAASTVRAMGILFLRRATAAALLAAAVTATAVGLAATSQADTGEPAPDFAGPAHAGANCKTEPWGFLGVQRRTLCDGPISSDGSWNRERTIWRPAHYEQPICSSSSWRYSGLNCWGGRWVDQRLVSNETYPVRPDTVLPDEPGHLG